MTVQKVELLTPPGRLIRGSCWEPQTKDAEGNPLIIKNGPNAGQPRVDYYLALAIEKTNPEFNDFWAKIQAVAQAGFPNLFDANGQCTHAGFAFKFMDGDSTTPNSRGNKPCDYKGAPGHWVLNFSSGFQPECFTAGGAERIVDPNMLKTGYYIRIYGNCLSNDSVQQPGIYLNHSKVELIGYGEEIITGISGEQAFGRQAVGALPAGASSTPVAPSTTIASSPNATLPDSETRKLPLDQYESAAIRAVEEAKTFFEGQQTADIVPAGPGASPSSPGGAVEAPPGAEVDEKQSRMTAAAKNTYAEYSGKGWTEGQLITKGYMTAAVTSAPTQAATSFTKQPGQ